MSFLLNRFNFLVGRTAVNSVQVQSVRSDWTDHRMKKDYRKRCTVKQYAKERLRINSIRKNDLLPPELKEVADKEIAALPWNGSITRISYRCCLTSRPSRGAQVKGYRLSRIMWRQFADHNELSGVQRAMW